MSDFSGLSMWLIVGLVILVWPAFFIALWIGTIWLISLLGGWRRLAKHFAASEKPDGRTTANVTGMVGVARYKRQLIVTTNRQGMFIDVRAVFRIGHPTLFIDWHDIYNARHVTLFYRQFTAFDVGNPKIAAMRLPTHIFDDTPVFID